MSTSGLSPLSLPIARLRARGCKIGHVIGHDPTTTGSNPNFQARWHYSVTLPEGVTIDVRRHNNQAVDTRVYLAPDGRVLVYALQELDPKATKPAQIRAIRKNYERNVAVALTALAIDVEGA